MLLSSLLSAVAHHQVLRRSSAYRVPLYVTETGVSIASDQEQCYTVDAYMKEVRLVFLFVLNRFDHLHCQHAACALVSSSMYCVMSWCCVCNVTS